MNKNAGHIYDNTDKPLEKMIHEMELNDYKVLDKPSRRRLC